MDTNLVTAIVTALAAKQTSGSQSSLLATIVVAAVIQTLTALAGYWQAKAAALSAAEAKVKAMESAEQARKMATDTNASVQAIHVAVNSERTAMMLELKEAREEIRAMSFAKATDDERERARAIAATPAAGLTDAQVAQIVAALQGRV